MTKVLIRLRVNGSDYELAVPVHKKLVDVLREDLGLTGTKKGCGAGECGSCTVLMEGKPVTSCLVLAVEAQGKDIITIEGISNGEEMHSLQKAFVEHGAIQCGYCTPGMILTAKALLDCNPFPTENEVKEAISGNLCRCTGYQKIVEAILSVAAKIQSD